MKQTYTLWGPQIINGEKRWGVNERRPYGIYTEGPRDGYYTRAEAVEVLRKLRDQERHDREIRRLQSHGV